MVTASKQTQGFTLIEVVVALALFSLGLLALTQSFTNGLWCKTKLSKENTRPFILQQIRQSLMTLPRDQVKDSHSFSLPNQKEEIRWTGTVVFGKILHLYRITVQLQEEKETIDFWVRRPDWMTASEKSSVLKNDANDTQP